MRRTRTGGIAITTAVSAVLLTLAATWALIGLWIEKDVLVRAGQALPIS